MHLDIVATYNGYKPYISKKTGNEGKLHSITNSRGEIEEFTMKDEIEIEPGRQCLVTYLKGYSRKTGKDYCFIVSISAMS